MLFCEICGKQYDRGAKSKRRTCSRSCAVSLSWADDAAAERRRVSIKETLNTPKHHARLVELNHRRWAQPGAREGLAEMNRARWSEPNFKAATSAAIRDAWTPEVRERFSRTLRRNQS